MGEGNSKPEQPKAPKPKNPQPQTVHPLSTYEGLVKSFAGTDKESVFTFIDQIRHVQREYNVPDKDLKLLISNKLNGKAKNWFHSKPSHITLRSSELLEELRRTYGNVTQLQQQFETFRARKWCWRQQEKFFDYYQDKLRLSACLSLSETLLVKQIIEGFDNPQWEIEATALNIQKNFGFVGKS